VATDHPDAAVSQAADAVDDKVAVNPAHREQEQGAEHLPRDQ
jgi:hypothetical protein